MAFKVRYCLAVPGFFVAVLVFVPRFGCGICDIVLHKPVIRRTVVQENLANSFPEKTVEERNAIEKKYYKYMADLMMETIKCITISEKEVKRRMVPADASVVEKYFSEGKSVVAATGHYCNWEMSCLRFGLFINKRRIIVYKPQSNEIFTDFFTKTRSRFGSEMIAMKQTLRKMIEYKK